MSLFDGKRSLIETSSNAPRQHDKHPEGPHQNAEHNGESAPRNAPLADNRSGNGANRAKDGRDDRKPWWMRIWVWQPWKRGLGIGAVLATIVYAVVTYYQWRDLRHNFQADQRPYLVLLTANISDLPEGIKKMGSGGLQPSQRTPTLKCSIRPYSWPCSARTG
jgi:hypothetical protein